MSATEYGINLKWNPPQTLPEYYHLHGWARYLCADKPYHEFSEIIHFERRSATILFLNPGSLCEVSFSAVYHEAKVDPDITQRIQTLSARKCPIALHTHMYEAY